MEGVEITIARAHRVSTELPHVLSVVPVNTGVWMIYPLSAKHVHKDSSPMLIKEDVPHAVQVNTVIQLEHPSASPVQLVNTGVQMIYQQSVKIVLKIQSLQLLVKNRAHRVVLGSQVIIYLQSIGIGGIVHLHILKQSVLHVIMVHIPQ